MMTDAMKPLGLSLFQLLSNEFPLIQIGGRLYVDIAHDLASPAGQKIVVMAAGGMDPLDAQRNQEYYKAKRLYENIAAR